MLRIVAAFALVLVGSLAAQAADTRAKNGADEVQQWIAQLDDEKFTAREDATDKLIMTAYDVAIKDVAQTVEAGSPEARTRALHILSVWHRADETSRKAVLATAARWQATKSPQMKRLGSELVAKTKPKPVQTTVQVAGWGRIDGPVIFLGGGAIPAMPVIRTH